jgi:hypothetical protein
MSKIEKGAVLGVDYMLGRWYGPTEHPGGVYPAASR